MIKNMFWGNVPVGAGFTLTPAGRVFLVPLQVEVQCHIDTICFVVTTQAGNVRVGIYRDNGDTAAGGALVVESASVACGAAGSVQEVAVADTELTPGFYWVAIQSDTTTAVLYRGSGAHATSGSLRVERFDNGGGYGAFDNPCPAIGYPGVGHIHFHLLVSSVP